MAMRLCRCFLQTLGSSNQASIHLSCHICLEMVHKIMKHSNHRIDPFEIVGSQLNGRYNLAFVSATFGSLAILSTLSVLSVVTMCIIMSSFTSISLNVSKSYLLQFFKTSIFGNAGNWTRLIELSIKAGMNVIYVLHKLVTSLSLSIVGLMMKINPISFAGSNPIHYFIVLGSGTLYGLKRQHDYSLFNVVGRFGSIGILVHLSYE
jgi:hypothetical protein